MREIVTISPPIIAAIIGAVVVLLGGMWGVVHLEISRMVTTLRLEYQLELANHKQECPGALPAMQPVTPSESKRIVLEFSDPER